MATRNTKKKPPKGAEIIDASAPGERVHEIMSHMLAHLSHLLGDEVPRGKVNIDIERLMRRVGAAMEERAILLIENDNLRAGLYALGAENDRLRTNGGKIHEKENTKAQAHPEKNKS